MAQANTGADSPVSDLSSLAQLMQALSRHAQKPRNARISLPMLVESRVIPAMAIASFLLGVLYLVHLRLPPVPEETQFTYYTLTALRQKFFHTDWISPTILWVFFFGFFLLRQISTIKHDALRGSESSEYYKAVESGNLDRVIPQLEHADNPAELGYYGARLHALVTRWNADKDLPACQALKNEILDIDEQQLAKSFVPIEWSESALPILGFLGTVVGIGQAMGSFKGAVQGIGVSGSSTTATTDTLLNSAFENMALAFDTTFFGLFFLLLLGIYHTFVRNRLAERINNARRFYSLALSQLPQGTTNVVVAGLSELTVRVVAVEEAIKAVDESTKTYRERLEGMVDRVIMDVPELSSVRRALMKPIVQFAESDIGPAKEFVSFIRDRVGLDWSVVAVGPPAALDGIGMACLSNAGGTQGWIATFGSELNREQRILRANPVFTLIYPSEKRDSFVAVSRNAEVWIGTLRPAGDSNSQDRGETAATPAKDGILNRSLTSPGIANLPTRSPNRPKPEELKSLDKVGNATLGPLYPISIKGTRVLIPQQAGATLQVYSISISEGGKPRHVCDLPSGVRWECWDVTSTGAHLVVGGVATNGTGSRIDIIALAKDEPELSSSTRTTKHVTPPRTIRFPNINSISQVQGLNPNQFVFTDGKGVAYYIDNTRNEPVVLHHEKLPKKIERLLANKCGWIAVVADQKVSMWTCRKGGVYPCEDEALKNDVLASKYVVSGDGRFLYNFAETLIFKWSFPKTMVD